MVSLKIGINHLNPSFLFTETMKITHYTVIIDPIGQVLCRDSKMLVVTT